MDLCDKSDADREQGELWTYANIRVYCETELKKQVFEAYDNKVRIENQGGDRWTTVVQTFNQLWGSTHEWTICVLVYKGVYNCEKEVIEDLYPHVLPLAKGKRK